MLYKKLYICDVETVYLRRLSAYLNRHAGFSWHIKTSTSLECCIRERPQALLVSGSILKLEKERMTSPEMLIKSAGIQWIGLDDEVCGFEGERVIKKYQTARKVYRELVEILDGEEQEYPELIGVYSPRGLEPDWCRELGMQAGERGDVLIIPLTEFPLTEDEGDGLGEWFYYQNGDAESGLSLSDYTYGNDGVDWVRGFRTSYDMKEVSPEAWHLFFEKALSKSRYHTVFLIFDRLPPSMDFFERCDSIYVQWGGGDYGERRREAFIKMVSYMAMEELMDKIIEL